MALKSIQIICFMFLLHFEGCKANIDLWRCSRSFLDLPTIYIKAQEYVDVCIPLSEDAKETKGALCGMDTTHACVAVRFLKNYNVPLYTAVRFQNTPDVVLGLTRPNNYPNGRPIGKAIPMGDAPGKSVDDIEKPDGKKKSSLTTKRPKETWSEIAWVQGTFFCCFFLFG
jgi:hypothetical protein